MATEMVSFTFRNGKIGFWNDPQPDDKSFGSVIVGVLDVIYKVIAMWWYPGI